MFKRILVAYDGSEGSRIALTRSIELAKAIVRHAPCPVLVAK